jgi:hypothetical protein
MYLSNKEYYSEVVEVIRISRNIIEKIFLKEIEYEFGKLEEVIQVYKNENYDQSYHQSLELDTMIKIFFTYNDKITLLRGESRKRFNKFINLVLQYRNQIAHNQLKTDNLRKDLETILSCISDELLSNYVKNSYVKFVKSLLDKF